MESGTLSSHPPSELLRGLASLRATGCLRLLHGDTTATVHFREGMVYTASAPAARTRLGDRLIGAGHITEEQLTSTLALQRSLGQPRRIGELLIERGLIDRETMRTYVREQIADSVAATLRWTEGEWTFSEGEEVAEDAPLDMSVENLLMEGASRLEEWGAITARLGSIDTIVDFVADASAAELSLTPDEWSMLTRIDGASTIAEIAEEAGYSQFEAARIIYGLLTAGVVTVVGEAAEDAIAGVGQPPSLEEPAAPDRGRTGTAWEPHDRASAGEAPPVAHEPPAPDVNRNELLREFAALDDKLDDASAPPVPPPKPAPPKPVEPPRDSADDRRDRRGIFRRRRD